jgi:hypothetical protein
MRKHVEVTITDEGRDKGKVFVLTEMPAAQAERWALRVLLAMARGGVNLPDEIRHGGMLGLAKIGLELLGHISMQDADALMVEMFSCVQTKPSPGEQPHLVRPLVESDIMEVMTRVKLRLELIVLHTGFSIPGFQSSATQTPGHYLPA